MNVTREALQEASDCLSLAMITPMPGTTYLRLLRARNVLEIYMKQQLVQQTNGDTE